MVCVLDRPNPEEPHDFGKRKPAVSAVSRRDTTMRSRSTEVEGPRGGQWECFPWEPSKFGIMNGRRAKSPRRGSNSQPSDFQT